jgi:PadR family transcriptional regulator, regulatory protein AphA
VLSAPELPEFHSPFLVQLTWAGILTSSELEALLASYAEEVRVEWLMRQEKNRRKRIATSPSDRQAFLWNMVEQHEIAIYQHELEWLDQVRDGLLGLNSEQGGHHDENTVGI